MVGPIAPPFFGVSWRLLAAPRALMGCATNGVLGALLVGYQPGTDATNGCGMRPCRPQKDGQGALGGHASVVPNQAVQCACSLFCKFALTIDPERHYLNNIPV